MSHAAFALQTAVFGALSGDGTLAALVGDRIFDAPARAAGYPTIVFGTATARDWGGGSDAGAEHSFAVEIWSRSPGKRECWEIAERVEALLHDQPLALDGHTLVNLRHQATEVGREADGPTWRALVRFRAVTEPA